MTSQPGMTSWRLASRLTMPFKGMLLTLRSVPQRLALVAHRLPSRADRDFLPFHQCASQRTAPHPYLSGAYCSRVSSVRPRLAPTAHLVPDKPRGDSIPFHLRAFTAHLVCGLEIFAEMLRPECFSTLIPAGGAVRLSAEQLKAPRLA